MKRTLTILILAPLAALGVVLGLLTLREYLRMTQGYIYG